LTRGSELYKFQEAILKELDRRERILGSSHANIRGEGGEEGEAGIQARDPVIPELFSGRDMDDVAEAYSWETRRRAMWMKRDPRVAVDLVADLVNFQLESFQDQQSYRAAADFIAQNPEKMANRLLSHLQYVFDVKDLQGLVPRMNQVYLLLEESKNLIFSLRECLDMKDAQTAVVITETLRRLSGQNETELLNTNTKNDGDSISRINRDGDLPSKPPLRRQRT
jgi:hypothetical protein